MIRENASFHEAVFCIGSNSGNRQDNVMAAMEWIARMLSGCMLSHVYATPDCNGSQKEYLNAVATGKTVLSPHELDSICKKYEISRGRDAAARNANLVPIDIDLVVYDGQIIRPRDFSCDFFQIGFKSLNTPNNNS